MAANSLKKYWPVLVILLLLAALAGMYSWKEVAVDRAREEVKERAQKIVVDNNSKWLHLVSVPLTWVVRSEMTRGNYEQVNQYMINFVRERDVSELALVKPDGVVMLATNKALEGSRAERAYPKTLLAVDKITVTAVEHKGLVAASPIMGLNRKLGVLLVVYEPQVGVFDSK